MPADLLTTAQLLASGFGTIAADGSVTTTPASASTTSGGGYDLGAGGALPAGTAIPLVCRVLVLDAHEASGGGSLPFTITHSPDNTNWAGLAGANRGFNDIITLSAAGQTARHFLGCF